MLHLVSKTYFPKISATIGRQVSKLSPFNRGEHFPVPEAYFRDSSSGGQEIIKFWLANFPYIFIEDVKDEKDVKLDASSSIENLLPQDLSSHRSAGVQTFTGR